MNITIEKKRTGEHISPIKEYKEDYDTDVRYSEKLAFENINEAFRDYQGMWEDDYEYEQDIYDMKQGEYRVETGDYDYIITIK